MEADAGSLLNHYKKLIQLRNTYEPLRKGYYLPVETANSALFGYARVYEQEAVVVVSNFGSSSVASPSLSIAISTLQAGTYHATELYSGKALGTVTVDEQGAVNSWSLSGNSLAADQTWLILLSQDSQLPTGLPAEERTADFQLYPNPAAGKVNIRLDTPNMQKNQLSVFDFRGQLLRQVQFSGTHFSLDTSNWPEGAYFLRVQNGRTTAVKRLMVIY